MNPAAAHGHAPSSIRYLSALMISPSARLASKRRIAGPHRAFEEPDRTVAECEIGAAGMLARETTDKASSVSKRHGRRRLHAAGGVGVLVAGHWPRTVATAIGC